MGMPGRKPTAGSPRNPNRKLADWVEVADHPFQGECPKLPASRTVLTRDGAQTVKLQAMTRRWWDVVSRMPHCVLWAEADWMFALSSAMVADAAFCGVASAMTELRNREKVLGTTVEFRRDLRIRYVEAVDREEPAEVTNLADYREL